MPRSLSPVMLSRRQLLRRLGYAGTTAAAAQLLIACRNCAPAPTLDGPSQPHVLILGAGLAGLCAAYEMERKGFRITILEAERTHVGGRVRTLRFGNGRYGEAGAMRIPAKHDLTRAYCKEFKLTLRPFVQSNPNAWLFARGTKVRRGNEAALKAAFNLRDDEKGLSSDDLWAKAVVARLKGLSDAERADLLAVSPKTAGFRAIDSLSLQQLFEQAGLSPDAIEFMDAAQGQEAETQYGADESLREELKEIWSHEFDEIVGGTDTLASAFAKNIRADIRMGCEVISLAQDGKSATAVYKKNGHEHTITADRMICTLPVPVLQRLNASPVFSFEKQRAIRELSYDSATKLLIGTNRRFWELDDGIHGGVTYTDLPTGTTCYPSDNAMDRNGSGPRDPGVSRAGGIFLASYSWGMTARRMAALPHAQRLELARRHLAKIHPQLASEGLITESASWSWDTHPWSGGAFAWFNPGQHSALYGPLIAAEGRIHFAGEHASLTHTWMQGALESALRVVQEIAQS